MFLLQVHLSKRKYSEDIDFQELAFETARSSGAQLANLVNMAATIASQAGRDEICNADLLKVCAGVGSLVRCGVWVWLGGI